MNGIFDSTPDHATLGRSEYWVLRQHRRVYFDSVLGQIYEAYPQQRKQVQIGDSYAMQAKMAATAYNLKWWMRRVERAKAHSPP